MFLTRFVVGIGVVLGGCEAGSDSAMSSFGGPGPAPGTGGEGMATATGGESGEGTAESSGESTGESSGDDGADAGESAGTETGPLDDTTGSVMPCECAETEACVDDVCVPAGPPGAGDVIFTELHPDPAAVSDFDGEWFELTNIGDAPVDLVGCLLLDEGENDDEFTIPLDAATVVVPGARIVMAKFVEGAVNGGVPSSAFGFEQAFSLSNGGDVAVLQCNGVLIDRVAYDAAWPFTAGAAMQLSSDAVGGMDNDVIGNWCMASAAYGQGDLGTPGTANTPCE
ncbi:MAG: lamin tail domain-containing protein [Myxococcota bacterium]